MDRNKGFLSLQSKFSLNNNLENKRTLTSLKPGESAFVSSLDESAYACKLLNLGILPKSKITLVRKAPFGGAYYVKLDGHQLAMRVDEAETIYIDE